MTYDNASEADGRHQAALDRAAAFMALYEVERLAERLERAERRRWDLLRLVGLR